MNVISSTDDQPTNWKSNQSNHYTAARLGSSGGSMGWGTYRGWDYEGGSVGQRVEGVPEGCKGRRRHEDIDVRTSSEESGGEGHPLWHHSSLRTHSGSSDSSSASTYGPWEVIRLQGGDWMDGSKRPVLYVHGRGRAVRKCPRWTGNRSTSRPV